MSLATKGLSPCSIRFILGNRYEQSAGVTVDDSRPHSWEVAPGPVAGRDVRVETTDGALERRAVGVDALSGGLVLDDGHAGERVVHAGEVVHVRLAGQA